MLVSSLHSENYEITFLVLENLENGWSWTLEVGEISDAPDAPDQSLSVTGQQN